MATTKTNEAVDMKLEVVVIGVSDVDREKAFYEKLGWRLDIDVVNEDFLGCTIYSASIRGIDGRNASRSSSLIYGGKWIHCGAIAGRCALKRYF